MPFPSKGENHINGIKNEKDIVSYMNKYSDNPITKFFEQTYSSKINSFEHQGGTKQKRDASYNFENGKIKGVSIKHHKNGSFDWINTTPKKIGVHWSSDLNDTLMAFKENHKDTQIPKKAGIRDDVDNILSTYLDKISLKDIRQLLSKVYRTEENTDTIIINDKKSKQLIMISESNLDPYCNPNKCYKFILKSTPRAKTSRQIWIKSADGFETNTNLRIRLHLNNGITALLGKSKANKSSTPSLKIQQDKVDTFISKCFGKVIANY